MDDEIQIICPDDMCRASFDGEGPPCGNWACVRIVPLADEDEDEGGWDESDD